MSAEQRSAADHEPPARLVSITVGDDAGCWTAAGFTIDGDEVRIGDVRIILGGSAGARGIRSWCLAGLDHPSGAGEMDGLQTTFVATSPVPDVAVSHRNGVVGLDHVVVSTPDLERTIAAFEAVGLRCRRIRQTSRRGTPMHQAFFRAGPTIIEVVGGPPQTIVPGDDATGTPAGWFGLAVDVDDLDRTVAVLGEGIGTPSSAVQPGRRIATLRHRTYGLSVAVAAMDDHADR